MLFTGTGGVLGSLYGYLNIIAMLPALRASDLHIPAGFANTYQERFFYLVLPLALISGWWIGSWRAAQIDELEGWRKWTALILLGLIVAILGYAASIALYILSA